MKSKGIIKALLTTILLILMVLPAAFSLELYMFYGRGCPHCGGMNSFLKNIQKEYPELNVKSYETYFNQPNRELFQEFSETYDSPISGVPTVYVDKTVFIGYTPEIAGKLGAKISECIKNNCETLVPESIKPTKVEEEDKKETKDEEKTKPQIEVIAGDASATEADGKGLVIFGVIVGMIIILSIFSVVLNKIKLRKRLK